MSADTKCQLSIVDMLLNDTATLDVFDKSTESMTCDDTDVRMIKKTIFPSYLL